MPILYQIYTKLASLNLISAKIYEEYYQIYRNLYPALKPQFDWVTAVVEEVESDENYSNP